MNRPIKSHLDTQGMCHAVALNSNDNNAILIHYSCDGRCACVSGVLDTAVCSRACVCIRGACVGCDDVIEVLGFIGWNGLRGEVVWCGECDAIRSSGVCCASKSYFNTRLGMQYKWRNVGRYGVLWGGRCVGVKGKKQKTEERKLKALSGKSAIIPVNASQ
jgi:hypothetical protein